MSCNTKARICGMCGQSTRWQGGWGIRTIGAVCLDCFKERFCVYFGLNELEW